MFDLIGDVVELLLQTGGVPGPQSLEGQRRARIVAAAVALTVILSGHFLFGLTAGLVMLVGGMVVAAWVLAFSLVDVAKELPVVPWPSIAAIFVAGASLMAGLGFTLFGR
jgi:hypothetical protein